MFSSNVDSFAKSYEKSSSDEVLVYTEKLKAERYQAFKKGSGHLLVPFIIGAGWGTDTKMLLQ